MKVEDLSKGQCLLVSAKGVANGKISLKFAELISNPNLRPSSIVGKLNASDDRFNQEPAKPRYAWMTGEPADIKEYLGVDVSGLAEGQEQFIGKVLDELSIQITETTEGSDYDMENIDTRAKRAGSDGDFIYSEDGKHIFVKSTVVEGDAKHVFLSNTKRGEDSSSAVDDAIEAATGGE